MRHPVSGGSDAVCPGIYWDIADRGGDDRKQPRCLIVISNLECLSGTNLLTATTILPASSKMGPPAARRV